MTKEEAARILDPANTREALAAYAYDPEQRIRVVEEACRIAARVLRATDTNDGGKDKDAITRAHIEREAWEKPCNVCCGGKIFYQYSNHVTLSINMFKKATFLVAECEDLNQDAECCTKSDQKYSAFKIHFCPECGRPLTHEGRKALEKRLGEYPDEI